MNELVRQDAARRRWLLLNFLGTLAIAIGLALAAQAWLAAGRVYWTGPAEARFTRLAWASAHSPQSPAPREWPGLAAFLTGLALRVRPDPLVAPRAVAAMFSLLATLALLLLTQELFVSRTITAGAGLLAALYAPRALLGVVPLPEIQLAAWLLLGLFCALRGLRRSAARFRRKRHEDPPAGLGDLAWLASAAVFFTLAILTRFSASVFAAFFLVVLLARASLGDRRISWWVILANTTALGVLIACWLLLLPKLLGRPPGFMQALARASGIHSLADLGARWRGSLAWAFLDENAAQLNLLGILGAALWLWREPVARAWMLLPAGSFAVMALAGLLTGRTPADAAWRAAGTWGMLLIPFTAAACVSIAPRGSRAGRALGAWRPLLPLGLFLCVSALFARELADCRARFRAPDEIIKTGEYLRGALADARAAGREPFRILIEPAPDASHLHITVMARDLDAFIDEYAVAEPGTGIPPFRSEDKRAFTQWLRERRVRLLVFRTPISKKIMISYPEIDPVGNFGEYQIFGLR